MLFLWATAPMLAHAIDVTRAWGFEPVSGLAWVKDRIGTGYWVRGRHEHVLIATRGSIPSPLPADRRDSIIDAPTRGHSVKPDDLHEWIERIYPDLPKLEMFARRPRPGWSSRGNQIECISE